jgi:glycosyltransferase involved in cell wall biosynthesis
MIGEGPLRAEIEAKARRLGVDGRVVFAGTRPDVPRLMLGAMDVFVFPSLYEGLGLALIEAQAAGIPAIVSDKVPPESRIVEPLTKVLSVQDSAEVWADAISEKNGAVHRNTARSAVASSPYNNENAVRGLLELYSGAASTRRVETAPGMGGRRP